MITTLRDSSSHILNIGKIPNMRSVVVALGVETRTLHSLVETYGDLQSKSEDPERIPPEDVEDVRVSSINRIGVLKLIHKFYRLLLVLNLGPLQISGRSLRNA